MSTALLVSLALLVLVATARPVDSVSTPWHQTAFQIQTTVNNDLPFQLIEHLDTENLDSQPSIIVLVLSCVAAFLALACIALTLYILKSLRPHMLAAWKLLPHFIPNNHRPAILPSLDAEQGCKHLYFDAVSDMESELDDLDEKYQDALDMTPHEYMHDLPLEEHVSRPPLVDDPPLPPMAGHCAASKCDSCPSPVPRPAWSVRAIDSPALGLSASQGNDEVTSESMPDPRRRAYRSVVPELDMALAMQLRPGLGLGADSAWMVRFLTTIFGWFAVVLTSNRR